MKTKLGVPKQNKARTEYLLHFEERLQRQAGGDRPWSSPDKLRYRSDSVGGVIRANKHIPFDTPTDDDIIHFRARRSIKPKGRLAIALSFISLAVAQLVQDPIST